MLGVIDLKSILEDQFRFFGDSAQFRMSIDVAESHDGIGEALQAVLQFRDPLHDLGRGRLRPDVGIECDLAFDLLNVLGNRSFAIVDWMDDLWNDACQWIGIRHQPKYNMKIRRTKMAEHCKDVAGKIQRMNCIGKLRSVSLHDNDPQPNRWPT